MRSARRWFKLILGVVLALFVTTSIVPVVTSPVYAQGVFGHKQSGSQSSDEKQKQEQAEKDRQAKEQAEKDRQAKEQAEKERQAKEQAEQQAREQAERDRQAKEQAERERQAKEQQAKAQAEQKAREQAERDRQAREQAERDRQAKEQAERERQAQEQAERDRKAKEEIDHQAALKAAEAERAERERVLRESQEQAARQQQAKEQAQREAREKAAKEAQARADQRNRNRVNTPTNPSGPRSGEKFERVGERPSSGENGGSRKYRPDRDHHRTYYPYDPGYRNQPPVYYPVPVPVPVPSEPIPVPVPVPAPSSDPEVIVIDRGPTDYPEPKAPTEEEVNVPDVQAPEDARPVDESVDEAVPDESVKPSDSTPEKVQTEPQSKQVELPEIPSDLLKPAEPGSPTEALNQICLGWLTGDMKLIEKHIDPDVPVRIYKRAKYSHKLSPEEFKELTADGLEQMNTREYKLEQVNKKNGKIYARGVHTYMGADGKPHRVILAYTLKKLKGVWAIVEVGYSTMAKVETKD